MIKSDNNEHLERKVRIFNIQKYNIHDGPGIRTLIFFKGCPLRCKWCANPESLKYEYQVMMKLQNCIHCGACTKVCPMGIHIMENGEHKVRRDIKCCGCRECEKYAYKMLFIQICGEEWAISDLMEVIREDMDIFTEWVVRVVLPLEAVNVQLK